MKIFRAVAVLLLVALVVAGAGLWWIWRPALAPRAGELLWDVGAGSGSVAVEWCQRHLRNRAVAFEARADRAERIARNKLELGGLAIEVQGFSATVVHALGSVLVLGRVLHAFGLSRDEGASAARATGILLTWLMILVASVLAIYSTISSARF